MEIKRAKKNYWIKIGKLIKTCEANVSKSGSLQVIRAFIASLKVELIPCGGTDHTADKKSHIHKMRLKSVHCYNHHCCGGKYSFLTPGNDREGQNWQIVTDTFLRKWSAGQVGLNWMRNSCIENFDLIFNQLSYQHQIWFYIKTGSSDMAVIIIVQDTEIRMLNAEMNVHDPLISLTRGRYAWFLFVAPYRILHLQWFRRGFYQSKFPRQ